MKNLLPCAALSVLLSSSVFADEFTGHRIGAGYSQTEVDVRIGKINLSPDDYGSGLKVEYGYDFNKFLGVDLSYEMNSGSIKSPLLVYERDLDGYTIKMATNLGYAFPIQSAFLKPFVKLGYAVYGEKTDASKFNDESIYYGLGLRFQYSHIYADISFDKFVVNDSRNIGTDVEQTAFTIGYKF